MKEEKIKIIHETGIKEYSLQKLDKKIAGQKAIGLSEIPTAWRLPFFVISKEIAEHFMLLAKEKEQTNFCKKVCQYITECLTIFDNSTKKIILRSSGEIEGMNERGKYDSLESEVDKLEENFLSLLRDLKQPIAYVVQPYLERCILGHLSNERRMSEFSRDWIVEYEGIERAPYNIGIRKWRTEFECNKLINDHLSCSKISDIKEQLRKVAYFYCQCKRKKRFHLEFVWSKSRIYLVQKDHETENKNACNPKSYNILVHNTKALDNMKVFKKITQEHANNFKKVQNVMTYKDLNLATAPLYILDDMQVIKEMSEGHFNRDVQHDFSLFKDKSIVIRTDICSNEHNDAILLPRSSELRCYNDITRWCKKNLKEIICYKKAAMLIHVFIPSISAAFSYSEPNNRIVTIQALWGLPEGLYYNSHDTFLLDTGSKDAKHIQQDKIIINSIKKDYKAVYITPDSEGKWTEKAIKPPCDWQCSITEDQAKYIALGSRLIAQKTNKPVSIMWFVGIDKNYYQADCIPWYHEIFEQDIISHRYRKNYYSEKEIVISSEQDLDNYKNDKNIRTITIHPKDDKTLRDKTFIQKVGKFAKERSLTIFLEGTILAHPVYVLSSMGVKILAKKNKELIERYYFNKLVRDKIPEKITSNMEQIICYKAKENFLIRYLKEKLLEETFEIYDASEKNIVEEIADTYEVLLELEKQVTRLPNYKNILRKMYFPKIKDYILLASLTDQEVFLKEYEKHINDGHRKIKFSIERKQQYLELELTIKNENADQIADDVKPKKITWKETVLNQVYEVLDEENKFEILKQCKKLMKFLDEKLIEIGVTLKKFKKIREEKNKKNGAFIEGYVLQETSMNTKTIKNKKEWTLPLDLKNNKQEHLTLSTLLFENITYTDCRKIEENKELIVRLNCPLALNSWYKNFSGKSIEDFFGKNNQLLLEVKRVQGIYYSFNVYLNNNDNQLTLPFI